LEKIETVDISKDLEKIETVDILKDDEENDYLEEEEISEGVEEIEDIIEKITEEL
jgi:hypothetical protein